ncbi:MAG TPA: hypothetical protein VHU84_16465, partial [Lacipirellulaceae bacterium]|nr:hypothetical protein [Lacipirellulaceae bacterium]
APGSTEKFATGQQGFASGPQATLGNLPNSNQGGGMLANMNSNNHIGVALLINYMASSFAAAGNGNSSMTGIADGSHFGSQSLVTTPQHG